MPRPTRRAARLASSQRGGTSASHRQPASTAASNSAVPVGRVGAAVPGGWIRGVEG
jgi:hypothetical protein